MADVFAEQIVKRTGDPKILLIRVLIVMGMLLALFLPFILIALAPSLSFLGLPLAIGGIWLLSILYKRQKLEFEYILTNGELDVDKIMGQISRKRLLSVDVRTFEILAPMTESYAREFNSQSIQKKLDFTTGPKAAKPVFAVFPGKDGQRTLLMFEPNERILDGMRGYLRGRIKEL